MLGLFNAKKKITKTKILVVDDEPDLVSIIQSRLEWCKFCEVITAGNGKEGLEKATNEKPDLILLDTNMPVMGGHEMLKRLHEQPELKDIPVIMVTVVCEPQDIATALSYGIVDYVTKPFDFTDLMGKIANTLKNKKVQKLTKANS